MDRVLIEGLECRSKVGVSDEERRSPQKLLVDIELGLDLKKAGRTDSFQDTADYAAVSALVKKIAEGGEFKLVEALAERAAEEVLVRFKPLELRVRVRKFSVPGTASVGAEIFRKL